MIAHFFIDRPIFAAVLSIAITLAGGLAALSLPIAQYPEIAPPTVLVSVTYPGATAQVMADTVAAPLEQQINGVEGMVYMSSTSGNEGSYTLSVTFALGTDLDLALVLVQNRASLAIPQLPEAVQTQGISIRKRTPNILLAVNLISPDGQYDDLYMSNYATVFLRDEMLRVEGVADISFIGRRDYSLRAWLDPGKLAARRMTAHDVVSALQDQNQAAALGAVGQQPAAQGTLFQLPIKTLGRLTTPEQFGEVILKVQPKSTATPVPQTVRLKDVARLELGAQLYDQSCTIDGLPSVGLGVYTLPGSNALDVADRVIATMEEQKRRFPPGLDYVIHYDTTPFVRESVWDVVKALRDAFVLVALIVLLFLQDWRAALIPLIAVPVAIIGTFAVMAVLGFSLNNISLFGLVLAVGIVVDDAIVVVENVERNLVSGLPAKEAARRAMDEVTGPIIAVALVLSAVFVPSAFLHGISGQFFRQFALTIAVSTLLSTFNSLTLSPALAALLLKPHGTRRDLMTRLLDAVLGWVFRMFNVGFRVSTNLYVRLVRWLLRVSLLALLLYAGLLGATYWILSVWPKSFIPPQDQGWLVVSVQLPDAASVQRTSEVMKHVEQVTLKTPGVAHTLTLSGRSVLLSYSSPNVASMFVILDPFDQRRQPDLHDLAILGELRRRYAAQVTDAQVAVLPSPSVPGIGTSGGFQLMVEDRSDLGGVALQEDTDAVIAQARQQRDFLNVFTSFAARAPQRYLDIDRVKAKSMGVSIDEIRQSLEVYLGSSSVDRFNEFGRSWQVTVQADGPFRADERAINQLPVRNDKGQIVPLGALAQLRPVGGPDNVVRYNLYRSAPINGFVFPTTSTGQVIHIMNDLAQTTLPPSMATEWTNLTYFEIEADRNIWNKLIFPLGVLAVFLVLSALYENWSLPLAVILVVPLCLLSAMVGVALGHMPITLFTQIGFLVLVGLACKNAILIVEYARRLRQDGKPSAEATLEACRLRLRPILMTSFAFIVGVLPLVLAAGAGAEMRRALGTAVFAGMIGVTFFGLFLTPVFFHVIQISGNSALFHSAPMRFVSQVLFGLLTIVLLGLPLLAGALRRRATSSISLESEKARTAP